MINASVRKTFSVLSIVLMTMALSSGTFVTIAHAQDMGDADTYGDNLGYADTYGDSSDYSDDLGTADTYGDNLGYSDTYGDSTVDTYGDNLGYADTYGDNLGYSDTSGDNLGYTDTTGDNLGYADTYGDTGDVGYADTTGDNLGYADTYGDTGNLGSADTTGDNLGYADTYGENLGSADTGAVQEETQTEETQQEEVQQEETQQEEVQQQEFQQQVQTAAVATPITITAPQYVQSSPVLSVARPVFASTPVITPAPVYHTPTPTPIVYSTPTPAPVITQPSNTTTTNTCTNGSCNTTNTYSPTTNTYSPTTNTYTYSNNGNTTVTGSYNTAVVTPVVQTPVQQTVQYVIPQQPQTIVYPAQTPVYTTNYQYPLSTLYCTITASPNSIAYNQPTTLSWSAPGATTAVLSDGIGSVAPNGSLIARPASSVDYVLTVWGPNGQTATCNVWITVSGRSVSLTQIPYTGFDFGPFGDAIYWLGLLAFAGALGYLAVYYKGGAMTFATEMVRGNKKVAPVSAKASNEVKVAAPVAHAAPIVKPVAVATNRATIDSMHVAHGHHGDMPRIVISRN